MPGIPSNPNLIADTKTGKLVLRQQRRNHFAAIRPCQCIAEDRSLKITGPQTSGKPVSRQTPLVRRQQCDLPWTDHEQNAVPGHNGVRSRRRSKTAAIEFDHNLATVTGFDLPRQQIRPAHEIRDELRLRPQVDLLGRIELLDLAFVHHRDAR